MRNWYARYLKGINLNKAAKTLAGYAALLYLALTAYMHATPQRAALCTAIATTLAVPVYLMIPKPAQDLMDNIADELLSRQASAGALAAKMVSAIPQLGASPDAPRTITTAFEAETHIDANPASATPQPIASSPTSEGGEIVNPTPAETPQKVNQS